MKQLIIFKVGLEVGGLWFLTEGCGCYCMEVGGDGLRCLDAVGIVWTVVSLLICILLVGLFRWVDSRKVLGIHLLVFIKGFERILVEDGAVTLLFYSSSRCFLVINYFGWT